MVPPNPRSLKPKTSTPEFTVVSWRAYRARVEKLVVDVQSPTPGLRTGELWQFSAQWSWQIIICILGDDICL